MGPSPTPQNSPFPVPQSHPCPRCKKNAGLTHFESKTGLATFSHTYKAWIKVTEVCSCQVETLHSFHMIWKEETGWRLTQDDIGYEIERIVDTSDGWQSVKRDKNF